MRFVNGKVFEKHLASLSPHQLGHLYLIASSDDFERKVALDAILSYILPPDGFVTRFFGSETSVAKVIDALDSPALFGSESIVIVDEVDKKLVDELASHFKAPLSYGYLLIGTKVKTGAFDQALTLDLIDERPWEKEKRWAEMLKEKAHAAGKILAPDAAMWMIERIEHDTAALSTEMDKLLCYCASKSTIERSDVEEVCSASRTHTIWQIADDLIWAKVFRANAAELRDAAFFHSLLASMRQQLMIGAKMHDLSQQRVPFSEWSKHFPKIWPKTLEKKAQAAERLGSNYFRDGLDQLFKIELLSKNSAAPLDALIDFFRTRFI